MFRRISHIGIVVNDMDDALAIWRDKLGLKQFHEARFDVEGIRSVFLSVSGEPGEMAIELMEPTDKEDMGNAVARRLKQKGEGIYHLAVVVDDIEATTGELKEKGFPVIERPSVAEGVGGRWLVHPKAANGVMVEGIDGIGLAT